MTVLVILAAFYVAVLLVNQWQGKRDGESPADAIKRGIVHGLVVVAFVFALLAVFEVLVVPALSR